MNEDPKQNKKKLFIMDYIEFYFVVKYHMVNLILTEADIEYDFFTYQSMINIVFTKYALNTL